MDLSLNRLFSRIGKRAAVLLSMFLLAFPPAAADSPRPMEERGEVCEDREKEILGHVGQIFILGNTVTPDSIILEQLPLWSGGEFTLSDLRSAERNLARLNLFEANPAPLVRILDREDDSKYKDIRVDVSERPFNVYFWAIVESLEFAANWMGRGMPTTIFEAAKGDAFPGELIRFVFTGERSECPFVISRLLPQ